MEELSRAVKAAIAFAEGHLNFELEDLALEEVYRSEDGKQWLITLGYAKPKSRYKDLSSWAQLNSLNRGFYDTPRDYKVFAVDVETGEVKSMKIRQP